MTDVTARPTARERQAAEVTELKRQIARWKAAIEGLTPNGSEFVDDPEADTCAQCGLDLRDRIHLRIDDPRRKSAEGKQP